MRFTVFKYILLVGCLLGCFGSTQAQKSHLEGSVTAASGQAIPGATIIITYKAKGNIVAFGFSDASGWFKVSYTFIPGDTLIASFSHLGYAKKKVEFLTANPSPLHVTLNEGATLLPEVQIRNQGIYQRGDTVNYSVRNFTQKQDQVIGDIIRRLPGIEVMDNGVIKYQGRPINKYYIEGLDLLEDKYNLANNNIPAGAVNSVQVIENHQPIKALDSFALSQQAALNIKLNEGYKGKIFGRAKAGTGYKPLAADAELVPMQFGAGKQTIATYKYNNTGVDYAKDVTLLYLSENLSRVKAGFLSEPVGSIPFPNAPTTAPQRFLFNNLHLFSFNHLRKLKNDFELKILIDATTDKQEQTAGNRITNFFPEDTVIIQENQHLVRRPQMFRGALVITSNTKERFIKNTLGAEWNRERNEGLVVGAGSFHQQVNLDAKSFSNDFSWLITKANRIWSLSSFVGYHAQPERFLIEPGIYPDLLSTGQPYDRLVQPSGFTTFYTANHISTGFKKRALAIENRIGFTYSRQLFSNSPFAETNNGSSADVDSVANKLISDELLLTMQNNVSLLHKKWKIALELPLSFISLSSQQNGLLQKKNRLLLNEALTALYTISSRLKLSMEARQTLQYLPSCLTTTGYVLKNYRTLSRQNNFFKTFTMRQANATLQYRDVIKSFFANGGVSYSNQLQNFLYDQSFVGSLVYLTALPQQNPMPAIRVFATANKYVYALKTSITTSFFWSTTTATQMRNGMLSSFKNNSIGLSAGVNTSIRQVNADYKLSIQQFRSAFAGKASAATTMFRTQFVTINAGLPAGFLLQVKGEEAWFRNGDQLARAYYFADAMIRKTLTTKKIQVEIAWLNIFNNQNFSTLQIFGNNQTLAYYQLRPSQFLVKAGFTF